MTPAMMSDEEIRAEVLGLMAYFYLVRISNPNARYEAEWLAYTEAMDELLWSLRFHKPISSIIYTYQQGGYVK